MNAALHSLQQHLQIVSRQWLSTWQARTPRERRWLSVMVATLAVTLIWLLLIEPAWREREKLQRNLPQLRVQAGQMRALTEQYASLPTPSPARPLDNAALEQALQVQGLRAQRIAVTADEVRLQFDAVPFAQLLQALASLQKEQRLSVHEASLEATADAGQVKGQLQLQRMGDE